MRANIFHAYLSAAAGTGLISLLGDPSVTGPRVWALIGAGASCYLLGYGVAMLAVLQKAIELEQLRQEHPVAMPKLAPEFVPLQSTTVWVSTYGLSLQPKKLKVIAHGLLNGLPFSENYWVRLMKVVSAPEFRTFQDECLQRRVARWKGTERRQGVEVNGERGRAVLRAIANGYLRPVSAPPPESRKLAAIGLVSLH